MNTKAATFLAWMTFVSVGLIPSVARSAAYTEAEFTQLENDVKVLKENAAPQNATVGQQIKAVTSVATGPSSRAELRFPDHSLTRLGANSRFTIRGEARTLDLNQGTMLLEVPKKMGGAKVRTAAVTAAVTGTTVMFEYLPNGYVKLIVIEGTVDLYENAHPSTFRSITAGQMIIMNPNAKTIPNPVDIDLKRLLKTSKLLNFNDLGHGHPNSNQVVQAVQNQQSQIKTGELQTSNLVIPGQGTVVNLVTNSFLNLFNNVTVASGPTTTPPTAGGTAPQKHALNFVNSNNGQVYNTGFPSIPGLTILNSTSRILMDPQLTAWNSYLKGDLAVSGNYYVGLANGPFPVVAFGNPNVPTPPLQPYLNAQGDWSVFRFEQLLINGNPTITSGAPLPIHNLILAADTGISLAQNAVPSVIAPVGGVTSPNPTGNTLDLRTDRSLDNLMLYTNHGDISLASGFNIRSGYKATIDSDITPQSLLLIAADPVANVNISGSIDLAGTSTLGIYAGNNVTLQGTSDLVANDIWINSGQNIIINGAPVTANGSLSMSAGNSIEINNGAQIQMLSSDVDASFTLTSNLGDIVVTSSTLISDGNLDLQSNAGSITLTTSVITGGNIIMNAGKDVNISGSQVTANGTPAAVPSGANVGHGLSVNALGSINVTNSSVLKVLASDSNALLQLISQQGKVLIDSSTLSSGYGIDVEATQGNLTINNSTLSGDVIKARTLGPNGQLIIGGGTNLSANTLLRLYSEGANGLVNFVGNSTLNGQSIQIAGKTVQVNNGVVVTIGGSSNLSVYTDNPNYNQATYGSFQNSSGTQVGTPAGGFSNRPAFK